MNERITSAAGSHLFLALPMVMAALVAGLSLYGYRAVHEWRRTASAVAQHAANEGADLLVRALLRDMRGAQALVLASRDAGDYGAESTSDFSSQVAAAFTRFPYPESFFGWLQRDDEFVFFNRSNRQPIWAMGDSRPQLYPVVVWANPPIANTFRRRILRDAANRLTYSDFFIEENGVRYEVVARLTYADEFREHIQSVTGFTVNLGWVRTQYFPEIVSQVAQIGEQGIMLDYCIVDEFGAPVAGAIADGAAATRDFPVQFIDTSVADQSESNDGTPVLWQVRVSAANDPNLTWGTRGNDWILVFMGGATLAMVLGFSMIAHAVRASAALTALRSEFVSTVTHELKTPLAAIRIIGDTLLRGRLDNRGAHEYAGMLVQEGRRLTHLVDNLLAYARVNDAAELYSYERLSPAELIEESLGWFQQQLMDRNFEVETHVPHDLPMVRGDRMALRLALDNLIDNAIRYSGEQRWLHVGAWRERETVVIEVRDRGVGIAADELDAVQRRFVRGRSVRTPGSGLGLAIVKRVVAQHAGQLHMESSVGAGTTVSFDLPTYKD